MRLQLLATVALCLIACVRGGLFESVNTTTLTTETFDEYIDKHPLVLVEFYMPWCDVCRTFKTEMERCKGLAASWGMDVQFAIVNAEDETDLRERFNLDFYPTFKLFRDGLLEDIGSGVAPLTGEGVIAGLRQALSLSPASTFARSLTNLEHTREWLFYRGRADMSMQSAVIGFFPPATAPVHAADADAGAPVTSEYLAACEEAFEAAAARLSGMLRFGRVTDPGIVAAFGVSTSRPSFVLFKDFDEGKEVYAGELRGDALAAWAVVRNRPLAMAVDSHNLRTVQRQVPTLVHVFTNERGAQEPRSRNQLLSLLRGVGWELEAAGTVTRGQILFTIVDASKHANWMDPFGLPQSGLPAIALVDHKTKLYYALPGVHGSLPTDTELPELDTAALLQFCQEFYLGVLPSVGSAKY